MPIIDDLNGNELDSILRRLRNLEHGNPMFATSLTTGRFRIGGTAVLLVDSSGGLVVHGTINGDGTITWTGTLNVNGRLNVASGGTIVVSGSDAVTIGPTSYYGVPGLQWSSGGSLGGGGGQVSLQSAGGAASITCGTTSVQLYRSGQQVVVDSTGVTISAPTTTSAANLYMNPSSGLLSRVTSARRFKIGPKLMKLAPSILDVRMKDWIDKGARKRGEPDVRVAGVIAEEVAAAGGESFVTRDADGEIEGVAYDRLAMARTQILADRLDAALARIDELERKLNAPH